MGYRDAIQSGLNRFEGTGLIWRPDRRCQRFVADKIALTAVLWPLHQPILSFADEMANIDNLSGGRLSLGLSNGSWPGEGDRDGSRTKAGGRLQETITVLKSLWLEPEVSFKGSHFNLEGASLDTRPIQNGGIPILVAGVTSASVNLAAHPSQRLGPPIRRRS